MLEQEEARVASMPPGELGTGWSAYLLPGGGRSDHWSRGTTPPALPSATWEWGGREGRDAR